MVVGHDGHHGRPYDIEDRQITGLMELVEAGSFRFAQAFQHGSRIGDRPREYSRISDILNDAAESFVRIDAEDDTYFVNKSFIRTVIPR